MTRASRLRLPADVVLLLRGLHPDLKRRVRAALDRIVAEPFAGCHGSRRGGRARIYEETLRLVRGIDLNSG